MLPPQLRQGLHPRSLTTSCALTVPSTARRQAVAVSSSGSHYPRSCFSRKYDRNDPRLQRLRHRIVRAKLLQSLYNKSPHASSLRSLSLGRSTQVDDAGNAGNAAARSNKNATGRHEDGHAFEVSEKEKHWKQRIDYIKRWIDEDPYEAMFGWSNRLRRGQSLRGWPFGNIPVWLQEEMSVAKDKISNEDKQKPEETEASQPKSEAKEAESKVQTAAAGRTPPPRRIIRRSIDEPPLEYDPISNRMIRKGDQAFSHYAQELDVDEASAKSPRPGVYPRKVPIEVIGERPKPSKTAIEPKDPRKGSLTPYKSSSSPNARAEYEEYKAQRLGEMQSQETAETEDTIEEGRQAVEATQQAQVEAEQRRAKLEEDFEKVQQKMTEHYLPSLTPSKIHRSRGTVLDPSRTTADVEGGSDSPQPHRDAVPVHAHREVLLMQLDDIDAQDKRVKQQISSLQKRIDPADKDVDMLQQKLESLWMKRKALETQRAKLNDMLREVRWTEPQQPQPTVGRHRLETALQRRGKDTASAPSGDSTLTAKETNPNQEPCGYEHARDSVTVAHLADGLAANASPEHSIENDLAQNESQKWLDKVKRVFTKEPTDTKHRQQREEAAAKSMLDEEVNRQKLAMATMENIPKQPLPSDARSLPDPDTIQKRAAEAAAKKEQNARDAELVREIRSAYEGEYGPITTHHRQVKESKAVEPELEDVEADLRTEEPLSAFTETTAPEKVETATEIRSIPSARSVSTTNEATESNTNVEPSPFSVPQESCSEPISDMQTTSATAEMPKPIPESDLTDVNATTTSYAILAYDHTTASITRATVYAPPNSTETPMPLTVALTQLSHPAKFLPYLQSLKERGFVPVTCSNNLLILRRTGPPEQRPKPMRSQESGNKRLVNPIDKTGNGATGGAHVPTGDFASPTGFVNYGVHDEHLSSSPHHNHHHHHHHQVREHRHNGRHHEHHVRGGQRRPRRLESVFSGGTKVQKPWDRKRERRKWKRWAKNVAASFGIAVAIIYVAGLVAEMRKVTVTSRTEDAS